MYISGQEIKLSLRTVPKISEILLKDPTLGDVFFFMFYSLLSYSVYSTLDV